MAERERAGVRVAQRNSAISAPARPTGGTPGPLASVRTTVLLFVAMCVVGVGPLLVVNGIFGALRVQVSPLPGLTLFAPTATEAPDIALPRQAWAAARVTVMAKPGGDSRRALLEPGFPVTITAHQRVGTAMWSHITWDGPTSVSGGEGWAHDSGFVAYGGQGRAIGDVGALSPRVLAAFTPYGSQFGAALYFPESGRLYHSQGDLSFALGDGFRPVLLAAMFAWNEAPGQRTGTAVTAATADGVASGEGSAASFAYGAVGGEAGVSAFLAKAGVAGIQPAQGNWQSAQATPNALLQFYAALATQQMLNSADRARVATLLGHAASPLSSQMQAILPPGTGGFLVIGVSEGAGGWTVSVCGVLVPKDGPRVVLAAVVRDQPAQASAETGLVAFYRELAALLTAA